MAGRDAHKPKTGKMIAFGPVPSRRLGNSLGINNIPPKVCSYSCVYCQVGRTKNIQVGRSWFYDPKDILQAVENHEKKIRKGDGSVDYLTFVADGEPALDGNLGKEMELLRSLGIDIAVITNASLMWREDVREDLMKADWVSLKLDAANERTWRRINRPHETLCLNNILDGCIEFSRAYKGRLVTETMLVHGINDKDEEVMEIGEFLARLGPERAYLSIPTRPPAEHWAKAPSEECINRAYHTLHDRIDQVEYLMGYEGDAFFSANGNIEDNLLSITSVHPMRESAVRKYLEQSGADWSIVGRLISTDQLIETEYKGNKFYLRKLRTRNAK